VLPPAPGNLAELLKIAMRDLNSYGITGVIEPGLNEQQIALYRDLNAAGEMTVRTDVLYRALRKSEVEKGIALIKAQKNDDMLRITGFKFLLDAGRGRRMNWPYRLVRASRPTRPIAACCCCRPAARMNMSRASS